MVVKSTIMPVGDGMDVMKFNPRSMQNSKSMIKSLGGASASCLNPTPGTRVPQSPRVCEVSSAVVAAAAKADDDAGRKEEEGVEDEEHHAQVPALAEGVLVADNVPAAACVTCN